MTAETMVLYDAPERRTLRQTARRFAVGEVVLYLAVWERVGEGPRALRRQAAGIGLIRATARHQAKILTDLAAKLWGYEPTPTLTRDQVRESPQVQPA